jgi:hypothetical protein
MIFYHNALKNFISEKLDDNTEGIKFDTILYNEIADADFEETTLVSDTYSVETKRKVPATIASINGEYISIPNITATNNSIELLFDLAVDDMSASPESAEFLSVQYNNTLLAIDEFRTNILANYFPLGTSYLMFGGSESRLTIGNTNLTPTVYYFELELKNNDTETIFKGSGGMHISKTLSKIYCTIGGNSMDIPYEINTTKKIIINRVGADSWYMSDGTDNDSVTATNPADDEYVLGETTGIECVLHRLLIDTASISHAQAELAVDGDIDTYITTPSIDLYDFDDKTTITNNGDLTTWDYVGENIILWGSDGNAVFQVYPLLSLGNFSPRNGINYHTFSLQLEALVSDNVLFGNNFEYELDGIQIYPVDRNHTMATGLGSAQKINDNYNKHLIEETSREHVMSFYYIPTKQLTNILKHIVSGSVAQNTIYELKVQYPFFNVTYNVVIENGGTEPTINSMSTFSVTFKRKSDFLT